MGARLSGYRLNVFSRALAALVGGYLLASAVAAAMAVYLPLWGGMARAEATVSGVMLGLLVYAVAFMAAFACRRVRLAWTWILLPAALLGAAVWLERGLGA